MITLGETAAPVKLSSSLVTGKDWIAAVHDRVMKPHGMPVHVCGADLTLCAQDSNFVVLIVIWTSGLLGFRAP